MVRLLGNRRLNMKISLTLVILASVFSPAGNGTEMWDCRHVGRSPFSGPWEVWREQATFSINDRVVSSPVWHDGKVFVTTLHGNLLCFEAGPQLLWELRLAGRILSSPWVDPWSGNIFVGTTTGQLYVIDPSGEIVAERTFDTAIVSGAVSDESHVYFGDWEGYIHCVSKDLEPIWSFPTGYIINAPLVSRARGT